MKKKHVQEVELKEEKDTVAEVDEGTTTIEAEIMPEIDPELIKKASLCDEYIDRYQRLLADFDNYKRRTTKEKETLYLDAVADTVEHFLPILDNLDRALKSVNESTDVKGVVDGVLMVTKQFSETLCKLKVEAIEAMGQPFDPNLHNAVMHIEDEACGENTILEEFQKGYTLKDRIIRCSMVKVAN